MFRKAATLISTLALALSITAASFDAADARHRRRGAIIGGLALGALALGAAGAYGEPRHYRRGGCYRGPRECHWVGGGCFYDDFGDYVCMRGHRECTRPVYCD
jgi:hypothetical protein